MGEVFRARDTRLNRDGAVKMLANLRMQNSAVHTGKACKHKAPCQKKSTTASLRHGFKGDKPQ